MSGISAWFTRVCIWVTARLICFRARAQRSGARTRNRERREADYEHDYECDSYAESCNPELNQAGIFLRSQLAALD